MTDQELLQLNAKGFIPGPIESEGLFLERVTATKNAVDSRERLPLPHWAWVKEQVSELFDFEPDSLIAFYSNEGLTPWQGAACWIDERGIPALQLREGFKKGRYLRFYSRDEALAHEAIHAARAAFQEPENEEFFAYASSEKKWRKVLGPILKRPWEAWIYLAVLFAGIFWEKSFLVAAVWMVMGLARLGRQHLQLSKAFKMVMGKAKNVKKARSALFRMTDREIRTLAKGHWPEGDSSLRWRLLRLAYFNEERIGS